MHHAPVAISAPTPPHGWLLYPAPSPWWDAAWFNDLLVLGGIIVATIVAVAVYGATQRRATRQRQESTLAHLNGAKAALTGWADDFFTTSYVGADVQDRAKRDYTAVLNGSSAQNYRVSTELLVTLIEPPGDAWPIEQRTAEAASIALQRMTVFNQMVDQQTEFNALHATEFGNADATRLQRLAEGADRISQRIHRAIGDAAWYSELVAALDANIAKLESELGRKPT